MEKLKIPEENPRLALERTLANKDLKQVCESLEKLNDFLIGERGFYSLPEDYKKELWEFLKSTNSASSVKIYLGDGGVSRLIIDRGENNKFSTRIGEASSDKVNEKWKSLI